MADPTKNAPNVPSADPRFSNVGGKVEDPKTEGGTKGAKEAPETSIQDLTNKLGGDKIASPSQAESDSAQKSVITTMEEKDGVKTITSSMTQEDADKAKTTNQGLPGAINLTASLTGSQVSGDIAQGGRLQGDKSVRTRRTIEDINAELDAKSGPNPSPNREGNEYTKAEQRTTALGVIAIDLDTNSMADDIRKIREAGSLSEDDKRKLQSIEDRLKATGSFSPSTGESQEPSFEDRLKKAKGGTSNSQNKETQAGDAKTKESVKA